MKQFIFLSLCLCFMVSCRIQPNSDVPYDGGKNAKVYRLRLNPAAGTEYHFDINNESRVKMEVSDKKMDYLNKSAVGVNYSVNKDSASNFLLGITYDKIHLYSKNGDSESDIDATNAAQSIDPTERMLGVVKSANISATISPTGEVKAIQGYKELGAKVMAGFSPADTYGRSMAQKQWDQTVGDGIVKKNMDQLFKIFPDSAVHIGDKWKLRSKQKGQFDLDIINSFTLVSIRDGLAYVNVEGDIRSDSITSNSMGYQVIADMKGTQEGDYTIETTTGMLVSCTITNKVEGSVQIMGRTMPVTITSKMELTGRRKKR